jgi:tRNA threonylcarbamoyladenosine biosynthesis protein TsaB
LALILCIETSTTVCSVALAEDGILISVKEDTNGEYSHAEQLNVFIDEVMRNHSFDALSAVAVSEGPGSYTGLRIGTSTAKGLAYAKEIPLISVNTLQAMCTGVGDVDAESLLIPMIDARRMEVYCAGYNGRGKMVFPTRAEELSSNSFEQFGEYQPKLFFGHGAEKCRGMLEPMGFKYVGGVYASAKNMIPFAEKAFQKNAFADTAYFEPFYLKDFVAGKKKKGHQE